MCISLPRLRFYPHGKHGLIFKEGQLQLSCPTHCTDSFFLFLFKLKYWYLSRITFTCPYCMFCSVWTLVACSPFLFVRCLIFVICSERNPCSSEVRCMCAGVFPHKCVSQVVCSQILAVLQEVFHWQCHMWLPQWHAEYFSVWNIWCLNLDCPISGMQNIFQCGTYGAWILIVQSSVSLLRSFDHLWSVGSNCPCSWTWSLGVVAAIFSASTSQSFLLPHTVIVIHITDRLLLLWLLSPFLLQPVSLFIARDVAVQRYSLDGCLFSESLQMME